MNWLTSIVSFFKSLLALAPLAKKVVDLQEKKLPMKIDEHEEKAELREIKNDIKEVKATTKLGRKTKKQDRKVKKGKIIIDEEIEPLAEFNEDK